MKKIGEGYYYNAYDMGRGRVLKKQKNKFQIFFYIVFANKFNIKNSAKESRTVFESVPKIRDIYKKVLGAVIDKNLIGNPVLLRGINYEQDRVLVIKDRNTDDFSAIVGDYIKLVKKLWSFGINDSVYNFTLNNGYNQNNEFILIDFNEVTFSAEDVLRDIKDKVWLKRSSCLHLSDDKKSIFRDLMERGLTEENLKKYWCANVLK